MAKDVITRFKLETTQYDSKLKTAAKGLSDFSKTATQAGQGFQEFTKKNIEAARALGTTATSTTNARDRVKELVGAYNEAAKAYNQLDAQQRQSDWAKALAGSLTQLQQRIRETKQEMQGLGDANSKMGGLFGGGKLDGMLQVFGGNLMTKGAGMLAGLASEMGDCIKQGIELARQGEGIRNAFERLNNPGILDNLREATHGTVTDIELMKAAVKFNDFKLPVEELGTMLAFAQQKAKDTGQSVDYMVDSIVTGLGRKSLMILDNLGLSASEIKDRMQETGDMTKAVGAIIRDQMAAAGDYVETAADRAAQANVSLQNKMEELGRKFAPVEEASNQLWTSMKIGILDIIGGPLTRLLNGLTEAGRLKNALNDMNGDGSNGQPTKVQQQLSRLRGSNFKNVQYNSVLEEYNRQIMKADELLKQFRANHSSVNVVLQNATKQLGRKFSSISELEAFQGALQSMRNEYTAGAREIMNPVKADIDTKNAQQNVESLRVKLAELEAQRKKAIESGDQDKVKNLTQQINQTKTSIKALDPTALKTTHTTTPKEQAQKSVDSALQKYNDAISLAAKEMEAGVITEADYKKRLLSGQQQLYTAYGTAYQTYSDPKYKEAQDAAAAEIVKLGGEVKTATEAQRAAEKAARELEQTQKKLATAQNAASDAWKANDLKAAYDAQKRAKAAGGNVEIPVSFTYTDNNLQAFIGKLKEQIATADPGSSLYNNLTERLSDATALGNLMQYALQNGVDMADLSDISQAIWQKLFGEESDVSDNILQGLADQIGQATGKGLSVNGNTGEVSKKENKTFEDFTKGLNTVAGGLSSVSSGLKSLGIDIPKEIEGFINVMNAVGQIISGVQAVISVFATGAQTANTAAVSINTGAIAALTTALYVNAAASAIPFFANGGVAHAAGGIRVPGNYMSGDLVPAMLNSGELVLNRAQQGVLADALNDGGMQNLQLETVIDAEEIRLVLNNNGRRTGRGEYVQSRNKM